MGCVFSEILKISLNISTPSVISYIKGYVEYFRIHTPHNQLFLSFFDEFICAIYSQFLQFVNFDNLFSGRC